MPVLVQSLVLYMYLGSPKSAKAIMLRLFSVLPLLFVTQISTRLMLIPLEMVGSVAIAWSNFSRKKWERKK